MIQTEEEMRRGLQNPSPGSLCDPFLDCDPFVGTNSFLAAALWAEFLESKDLTHPGPSTKSSASSVEGSSVPSDLGDKGRKA